MQKQLVCLWHWRYAEREKNIKAKDILVDCQNLIDVIHIHKEQRIITWRLQHTLHRIRILLNRTPEAEMGRIPRDLNEFPDKLAGFTRLNLGLTLFHSGMHLPRWVFAAVADVGFCF